METKRTVYSNSLRKMKRRLERVVHCVVFLRTRSVSTSLEFIYALNANNCSVTMTLGSSYTASSHNRKYWLIVC